MHLREILSVIVLASLFAGWKPPSGDAAYRVGEAVSVEGVELNQPLEAVLRRHRLRPGRYDDEWGLGSLQVISVCAYVGQERLVNGVTGGELWQGGRVLLRRGDAEERCLSCLGGLERPERRESGEQAFFDFQLGTRQRLFLSFKNRRLLEVELHGGYCRGPGGPALRGQDDF